MKKLGVALGSGGVRGLVHIGVLKSLDKHGVKVSYFSGTSIGSLVGAMYAAGRTPEEIEDRALNNRVQAFLALVDPSIFNAGLVDGRKLGRLIKDWIGVADFAELSVPVGMVAADLVTGEQVVVRKGNVIEAARASMAVPSIFKPVTINDQCLVDGGIINPVPAGVVKEMGADVVLAVNLDFRTASEDGPKSYRWTANVLQRTLDIARHYLAEYSMGDADIVLNPEMDVPGVIGLKAYLTKKRAKSLIDLGEKMMDERVDELKGLLGG